MQHEKEKGTKSLAKVNKTEGKYQTLQEIEVKRFFVEGECKMNK